MSYGRCLLIDDSEDIHLLVKKTLADLCLVTSAFTADEGRSLFETRTFDIVIIDLMLDNEYGMDLLSEFKSNPGINKLTRFFIMTGKTSTADEALGHTHGVDEYIKKPVDREVLKAIVRKNLKSLKDSRPQVIDEEGFLILPENHQVFLKLPGGEKEEVTLTVKEFKLLLKLVSQPDKTFSREDIFAQVWENDSNSTFRTIDMHISSLRKKLKDQGAHIKTIHQVGYKYSKS